MTCRVRGATSFEHKGNNAEENRTLIKSRIHTETHIDTHIDKHKHTSMYVHTNVECCTGGNEAWLRAGGPDPVPLCR